MTEAPAEIAQLAGNASGPLAPLGKTPDSAATSAPSKPGGTGGNGTTANGSSAIPIEPGLLATPNGLGSHSANHEEHDQQQTPEGPPAPGSGPRVRSIKTKEQKEALEAAYISRPSTICLFFCPGLSCVLLNSVKLLYHCLPPDICYSRIQRLSPKVQTGLRTENQFNPQS